jgi:hypothetical protein
MMEVQYTPQIHGRSEIPNGLTSTKVQVEEEKYSEYNNTTKWTPGQTIFVQSKLFKGKGVVFSRTSHPRMFEQERYRGKEMIIRLVGQTSESVDGRKLFMGGVFEGGIRGLPPAFILNTGLAIARRKSPHFFIDLKKGRPFIAVPLLGLVDSFHLEPLSGRSSMAWLDYDLRKPVIEKWSSHTTMSPARQREVRLECRQLPPSKWPQKDFVIQPYHLFAFEIADSAFVLEQLKIQWKVATLLPYLTVNLKRYIDKVPFSIFALSESCEKHQSAAGTNVIPTQWRHWCCAQCFPPRNTSAKILLSLQIKNV